MTDRNPPPSKRRGRSSRIDVIVHAMEHRGPPRRPSPMIASSALRFAGSAAGRARKLFRSLSERADRLPLAQKASSRRQIAITGKAMAGQLQRQQMAVRVSISLCHADAKIESGKPPSISLKGQDQARWADLNSLPCPGENRTLSDFTGADEWVRLSRGTMCLRRPPPF